MAETGEAGLGRMAEPMEIVAAVEAALKPSGPVLAGRHVLVTSGPTHEPIDPVRYLANRSSGKQGHAIAAAAAAAGAEVTLVTGPVDAARPAGRRDHACRDRTRDARRRSKRPCPPMSPIMAAAVADWRVAGESRGKIKKDGSGRCRRFSLVENPDILATIGRHHTLRPALVVGFAAETANLLANAEAKLLAQGRRLDPRQRRLAGRPGSWAATRTRST